MTPLIIVTLLVLSVAASPQGGPGPCASFCVENFHPPSNCMREAAMGQGPCYTCGPLGTSPTQQLCGGVCVETASDSNNCGGCGNVCPAGSTCQSSSCICTNNGLAPCNGACPDLSSDPNNCGACGNVCPEGTCTDGECECPTPPTCGTCGEFPGCSCYDTLGGVQFCAVTIPPDCPFLPPCDSDSDCGEDSACVVGCCGSTVCVIGFLCGGYL